MNRRYVQLYISIASTVNDLYKDVLASLLLDLDWPVLVKRHPARVQNSRGDDRVLDSRQTLALKVCGGSLPGPDGTGSIDEYLQRLVPVTALSVKVAVKVRRVLCLSARSSPILTDIERVVVNLAC